jgi:aspartyl-tRNA(Asn)/glutamyl-tRNA(Gln) amidotransferase subunit C
MPRLSLQEVEHVALLSRLRLTEDEKHAFADDLDVILEQFQILQRLDTEGVAPTAHAMTLENVFREDAARPSLKPEEVLSQAPEAREQYFVVPRIVET